MDGSFLPLPPAAVAANESAPPVTVVGLGQLFLVSPNDGRVIRALHSGQSDVSAVDLEEWRIWWGEQPDGQMLDLSDVGHWRAGVYVPPCHEWRQAVAIGRAARRLRHGTIFVPTRRR